tara:strand:- start:4241 stop:5404 length:1164 start_codon:yes stop_codon:yes gene_type:complete
MPGFEVIGQEEINEINQIFNNGGILFRQGFENLRNNCFKVKEFEKNFAQQKSINYALAVSSGTAALRVALAAIEISEGDEVITQSFTFVATVEAIVEAKAKPIICNIDKTLNMDPEDLKNSITPRTKAVIAVHMLGVPAHIKEIREICKKNNIHLIEDTAWGCGGSLDNQKLGTFGSVGTFSFDFAKTMTTGEGGMLVFNEKKHYENASAWHDHGHQNNPLYPRWEDTRKTSGFNFRMTELQGAVGIAQLKKLSKVIESQRSNKLAIKKELEKINAIEFRTIPTGSFETADALIFFTKDKNSAINCRDKLIEKGLNTKILPEAYTWHFAGTWDHIKEISENNPKYKINLQPSHDLLSKAVSIPITVKMNPSNPTKIKNAIEEALLKN